MVPPPNEYLPIRYMTIQDVVNHCVALLDIPHVAEREARLQAFLRFILAGRYVEDDVEYRVFLLQPPSINPRINVTRTFSRLIGVTNTLRFKHSWRLLPYCSRKGSLHQDVGSIEVDISAVVSHFDVILCPYLHILLVLSTVVRKSQFHSAIFLGS